MIARVLSFLIQHTRDWVSNFLRDMKSLRALWNWLYLALYVFISIWLVLHNAETCGNAVVYTTGGIVSTIFSAYCWSSYAEKKLAGTVPAYQPQQQREKIQDGNG